MGGGGGSGGEGRAAFGVMQECCGIAESDSSEEKWARVQDQMPQLAGRKPASCHSSLAVDVVALYLSYSRAAAPPRRRGGLPITVGPGLQACKLTKPERPNCQQVYRGP